MDANMKNGMAILEEFLQEKYVESYGFLPENMSKIEGLISIEKYSNYFYIPAKNGIGSLKYIVDEDGRALYLINKKGLPKEIQESLVGGDANEGTYYDYYNLIDVYGVTSDLKVYYCSNGRESIYGVTEENLDKDNPQREVFKKDSEMSGVLSNYDVDNNGTITAEELKGVKDLTIDDSVELTELTGFSNLGSLETLTLKDKTLKSLDGLQGCLKLNYIYLKNCEVEDYSALKGITKSLKYLYIHSLDDDGFDRLCSGMESGDFEKLEYFGVFGREEGPIFLNQLTTSFEGGSWLDDTTAKKTITNLSPIEKLSKVTKEKIKYLLLNNNNLTDTEEINNVKYLSGFVNVYLLRLERNSLKTLKGLENMKSLTYLSVPYNKLGEGLDGEEENELVDCLASLKNNTSLYAVLLMDNINLRQVDYFSNNSNIRYLYMSGCNRNMNVNNIGSIILACGTNYSLPCKFLNSANYNWSDYFYVGSAVDGKEPLTADNLKSDLFENSYIKILNLASCKITDVKEDGSSQDEITNSVLNEILKSMEQLEYVNLSGTNLETLDFCKIKNGTGVYEDDLNNKNLYAFCPNLVEIDIHNTYITSVKNLNNVIKPTEKNIDGRNLNSIYISKSKDGNLINDLSSIESVISGLEAAIMRIGWGGLHIDDFETAKLLENLTGLKNLSLHSYFDASCQTLDLSNLTQLENFDNYYGHFEIKLSGHFKNVSSRWSGAVVFSAGSTAEYILLGGICQHPYVSHTALEYQKLFEGLANCSRIDFIHFERLDRVNYSVDNKKNGNIIWNGENTKRLHFSGGWNYVSPQGTLDLTGFGTFNKLEEISFASFNSYTDDLFEEVLGELSQFENLKKLIINSCKVTSDSLEVLGSLQSLEYLDIGGNNITDISFLKNLTNLKDLLLSNNQISSLWPLENLTHLGEAYEKDNSGNDVYGRLDLSNNPLSDIRGTYIDENGTEREYYNMRILANLNVNKNGKLRRLFLEGCSNITENGLNILRDNSLSWMNKSGF